MENRYVCPVCGGPQVGVGPCPCFVNHLRERVIQPEDLHVKVGNLEIRTRPREGNSCVIRGHEVQVLLDGKPFAVRSLDLHIAMDELVTAKVELFPKSGEQIEVPESVNVAKPQDLHLKDPGKEPPARCEKCGWLREVNHARSHRDYGREP